MLWLQISLFPHTLSIFKTSIITYLSPAGQKCDTPHDRESPSTSFLFSKNSQKPRFSVSSIALAQAGGHRGGEGYWSTRDKEPQACQPVQKGGKDGPDCTLPNIQSLSLQGQKRLHSPLRPVCETPPRICRPCLVPMAWGRQGGPGEGQKTSRPDGVRAQVPYLRGQAQGVGPHHTGGKKASGWHGTDVQDSEGERQGVQRNLV